MRVAGIIITSMGALGLLSLCAKGDFYNGLIGGGVMMILSRLVDTFFSRISLTMPLPPKFHNTAYVLLWEEDLHWQSRSSGCSSS